MAAAGASTRETPTIKLRDSRRKIANASEADPKCQCWDKRCTRGL